MALVENLWFDQTKFSHTCICLYYDAKFTSFDTIGSYINISKLIEAVSKYWNKLTILLGYVFKTSVQGKSFLVNSLF